MSCQSKGTSCTPQVSFDDPPLLPNEFLREHDLWSIGCTRAQSYIRTSGISPPLVRERYAKAVHMSVDRSSVSFGIQIRLETAECATTQRRHAMTCSAGTTSAQHSPVMLTRRTESCCTVCAATTTHGSRDKQQLRMALYATGLQYSTPSWRAIEVRFRTVSEER